MSGGLTPNPKVDPMSLSPFETRLSRAPVTLIKSAPKRLSCLGWAPAGSPLRLATGGSDGCLRVHSVDPAGRAREAVEGRPPASPNGTPPVPIDVLTWSPEAGGSTIATGGADRCVKFWDVRTARVEQSVALPSDVLTLAYNGDGSTLAVGTRTDHLLLLDARRASVDARKAAITSTQAFTCEVNELAWNPDGFLFVATGPKSLVDTYEGVVQVLRPPGPAVVSLRAHTGQIQSLRFDAGFKHFATSSTDSTVAYWDAASLSVLRTFDRLEYVAKSLSFSADGAYLATSSDDKLIDVTRVADGTRVRAIPVMNPGQVAFAPQGFMLAWVGGEPGDEGAIKLVVV